MDAYYSYTLENLEDSGSLYTFYSQINKRIYSVSFDTYMYQEFLNEFPFLLNKGCALGFYNVATVTPFKIKYDIGVSTTIIRIIKDYLTSKGSESVLLYHCDVQDERQYSRHLLFDKWYKKGDLTELIKEGIEVEVPLEEGKMKYYLGYITSKDNPHIESIKKEFDAFSYNMISFGPLKNGNPT